MRQAWSESEIRMIKKGARAIHVDGCTYYQAIKVVRSFLSYRSRESIRSKLKRAVRIREAEAQQRAALMALVNET